MRSSTSRLTRAVAVIAVSIFSSPGPSGAQNNVSEDPSIRVRGRHSIMVHAGLLHRTSASSSVAIGNETSETRVNGFLGSLSYSYWPQENWAVATSVGLIDAEVSSTVVAQTVTSSTAVVLPLLFGVTYAPATRALGPSLRPHVSAAAGPYLGIATTSIAGAQAENQSISETTLGLRLQAGMDLLLGHRFISSVSAGYHFVSPFAEQIGTERDFSGPEFSLGFGVILGKGR